MTASIRIRIDYRDAAPCEQTWPLREASVALRFLDCMDRAHSGRIVSARAEVSCDCGEWHSYDAAKRECCGEIVCPHDAEHECDVDDVDEHWRGVSMQGPM